jgi:hypothetical protein
MNIPLPILDVSLRDTVEVGYWMFNAGLVMPVPRYRIPNASIVIRVLRLVKAPKKER